MIEMTAGVVHALIRERFPEWSDLPIQPVARQGWDNRTFRLGDELAVRLPSAGGHVGGMAGLSSPASVDFQNQVLARVLADPVAH